MKNMTHTFFKAHSIFMFNKRACKKDKSFDGWFVFYISLHMDKTKQVEWT